MQSLGTGGIIRGFRHQSRSLWTYAGKEISEETLIRMGTPQLVNDKWRKPRFSKRKLAGMRKASQSSFPIQKPPSKRPPIASIAEDTLDWCKGTSAERNKAKRQAAIEAKMATMDELIQKHREAVRQRHVLSPLEEVIRGSPPKHKHDNKALKLDDLNSILHTSK